MELTHVGKDGNAKMVNVSEKEVTVRRAAAEGRIAMKAETLSLALTGGGKKGNVLNTAKVAAIMAAKNTASLIPMCHTLPLEGVDVDFSTEERGIRVTAEVFVTAKTGAEMEALTAVSAALLTIYDMLKAVDKGMEMSGIRLLSKSGGKSGDFVRKDDAE